MGWDGQLSRVYRLVVREKLKLTTAASVLVPGATSFAVRNNADNANNLLISDAGAVTTRNALTVTTGGASVTGTTAIDGRMTTTDGVSSGTAKVVGGRFYSNTASGTSLTSSNTETVLGSTTIPASTLKAGSTLRARALISVTADNSTTTLTARLRLGGTTLTGTALLATTATNTSANDIVILDYVFQALAAPGASAACRGCGYFSEPGAVGGAFKTAALGTGGAGATFATNAALLLEVTGQWSASDANACQLEMLDVWID